MVPIPAHQRPLGDLPSAPTYDTVYVTGAIYILTPNFFKAATFSALYPPRSYA